MKISLNRSAQDCITLIKSHLFIFFLVCRSANLTQRNDSDKGEYGSSLMDIDVLCQFEINHKCQYTNDNIVKLLDSFVLEDDLIIIFELVEGKDLFDIIYESGHLNEDQSTLQRYR